MPRIREWALRSLASHCLVFRDEEKVSILIFSLALFAANRCG